MVGYINYLTVKYFFFSHIYSHIINSCKVHVALSHLWPVLIVALEDD